MKEGVSMNERALEKRFNKMENIIYKNIFMKANNSNDALKESLEKYIKYLIFANLRFTIVFNCLLKSKHRNLFTEDISTQITNLAKTCVYLDKVLEIVPEIFATKK